MNQKKLDAKHLHIAYECLSAIGNSFTLESMMGEVVSTFFKSTKALYTAYHLDVQSQKPLIAIGSFLQSSFDMQKKEPLLKESKEYFHIFLPLRHGCLVGVYEKKEDMLLIYSIISDLSRKINFAMSACDGVRELEELNEKLHERVHFALSEIDKHEEMLLLQSKNAAMGQMLEMIAHQWRQPITSIGMIANNLLFSLVLGEDEALDRGFFEQELEDINKQIQYLSSTIDDFRSFFKESKKMKRVVAEDILNKSVNLVQKQFSQHDIHVLKNKKYDEIYFYTFKNELIQVVLNLLHNAQDAFETQINTNKKITLSCFLEDGNIIIEVEDNAGGIEEEIMEKLFEPYFSTKKEKNGTGLGLYMSKIIVQKHLGGEISAYNKSEGAVFRISLPNHEMRVDAV